VSSDPARAPRSAIDRETLIRQVRELARGIEVAPTVSETYFRLADLLERLGRPADVLTVYVNLCAALPDLAVAHFNRGVYLRRFGRLDEAVGAYRRAIALNVEGPAEAWSNLGVIFGELERHAEARAAFAQALDIDPTWIPALYNLGLLHEEFGEREAALELFERVLSIDPDYHDALARIAHARAVRDRDDPLVGRLRAALGRDDLHAGAREALSFALGKVLDDCGCYDEAFAAFGAGNAIARGRGKPYDRDASDRDNAALRDRFGTPWLSRAGSVSTAPLVFVCGMWRSGTTLLERMLGAHPTLVAGGEIAYFSARLEGEGSPERRAAIAADERALASLGRGYLELLRQRFPGARRVIDKRPDNWRYLGLLHGLFPEARFIVMRRDPLDTCLSIFFQQFGDEQRYATDLGDIAHYQRGCDEVLRHWRALFPQRILEVQYERLVTQPEQVLQQVCAFLGLPWDSRMLDFTAHNDRVRTASVWQVREPLHPRSIGRSRPYAKHLRAIVETLGVER
jgi:tetratricopeptide (TPR) repeat protein